MRSLAFAFSLGLVSCYGGADLTIRGPMNPDGGGVVPGPCGAVCSNPPASVCEGTTMLRKYSATGTCGTNGCSYTSSISQCSRGCAAGACVGDPCSGVNCAPPAPSCVDAGLLLVTTGAGICTAGRCEYPSAAVVECPDAGLCVNGACMTNPCVGVDCSVPPAPYCADEDTLTTSAGTCRNGRCDWTETDSFCPYGCVNDACAPDPCLSITCDTPPSPFCSGSFARTYAAMGRCVASTCVYSPTTTFCTLGCSNGACNQPDAGAADAGRDAGAADAGRDAGAADAGTADAGAADGGVDAGDAG